MYQLVKEFLEYRTKADKTNLGPGYLVSPSQNVLINDQKLVEIRAGYTIYPTGSESSNTDEIESAFDWQTNSNTVLHLRGENDAIEFYDSNSGSWVELEDGFSAVDFCFTTWWDTDEGIDLLLFVNGGDKIYDWSGGITTLKSATANTITKNGTTSWAEERFLTDGTRQVIINGTTYAYTGGEDTTTLTGVTPNPSSEAADSTVFQAIRTNDNKPADGVKNDIIKELDNQIWVGSNESNEVYVSANDDFTDFTYSTPRVPGEGALLTLDSITRAFAVQEHFMYISAGRSHWYKSEFEQLDVGGTLTETLKVKKLKTGSGQAAQSQDLVAEVGDYIAFIDFNNVLRLMGIMEDVEKPHQITLSDPIKPDFDDEDFTGGHIKSHKNRIYISAPASDKVYINEMVETYEGIKRFWQPPQTFPVQKFAIIGDEIYGHSNSSPETYKLFDGLSDNGNSFNARMVVSYMDYGDRSALKVFDEWLTEGYIGGNTKIAVKLNYDYGGNTQQIEKEIDATDEDILEEPVPVGSLGDSPIGTEPLGGGGIDEEELENPKFRIIHDIATQDFFQIQVEYSTDIDDAEWKILAFGPNVRKSVNKPTNIKK